MSKNEERISAALAGIKAKVETKEKENDDLRAKLLRVQSRLNTIKENKLYSVLPSWLREKLESIFDDEEG